MDEPDSPPASEVSARRRAGTGDLRRALWFLAGAVGYIPGLLYAERGGELNRAYRLGLYSSTVLIILLFLALLLSRNDLDRPRLIVAFALGWILFSGGGPVTDRLGGSGWTYLGGAFIVAAAGYRLARHRKFQTVLTIATVVVVGTPILIAVLQRVQAPLSAIVTPERSLIDGEIQPTASWHPAPDIWFVLLDGYPSDHSLRSTFDYGGPALADLLDERGFLVNANALSPYAVTHLALPALLNGATLKIDSNSITGSEMPHLRQIIAGENLLSRTLGARGYKRTFVENGWHMSSCGAVEHCLSAPLFDEQIALVLEQSLFSYLFGVNQDAAFSHGVKHTMKWMERLPSVTEANGYADFVFLHLIAPHPPFGLRTDCSAAPGAEMRGSRVIGDPDTPVGVVDARRELYVEQVVCVTRLVSDLIDSLGDEAIIAVVGDHGPDSHGQLAVPAHDWTFRMIEERLLTIAALRLPDNCDGEIEWTLDVTRAALECVTGIPAPRSTVTAFITSFSNASGRGDEIVEVDEATLAALMSFE